jgi:large subunit ribosomal protein L9
MEVILIEKHSKLGEIGNIVNVKNGYARNYLIPTNKAIRATEENKKIYELRKVEIQKEFDSKKVAAEKIKQAVDTKHITLIEQAAEDERLYGSVNASHIAKAIKEQLGQEFHKSSIHLISQIKHLGVYEITINIFSDINATVKIIVARTTTEAEQALKKSITPPAKEKKKDKPAEVKVEEVEVKEAKEAKEAKKSKTTEKKTAKAKTKSVPKKEKAQAVEKTPSEEKQKEKK